MMSSIEIATWVNVIATVALAILTLVYVRLTHRILRSSEKMGLEQIRPYVVVRLYPEDDFINLLIKNVGKRIAVDVKVDFDPSLDSIHIRTIQGDKLFDSIPLLCQKSMPPEHEVKSVVNLLQEYVKIENPTTKFIVTVSYSDTDRNRFLEHYSIDLSTYIYAESVVYYSDNHYYQKISSHLKSLNSSIEKILKAQIK